MHFYIRISEESVLPSHQFPCFHSLVSNSAPVSQVADDCSSSSYSNISNSNLNSGDEDVLQSSKDGSSPAEVGEFVSVIPNSLEEGHLLENRSSLFGELLKVNAILRFDASNILYFQETFKSGFLYSGSNEGTHKEGLPVTWWQTCGGLGSFFRYYG